MSGSRGRRPRAARRPAPHRSQRRSLAAVAWPQVRATLQTDPRRASVRMSAQGAAAARRSERHDDGLSGSAQRRFCARSPHDAGAARRPHRSHYERERETARGQTTSSTGHQCPRIRRARTLDRVAPNGPPDARADADVDRQELLRTRPTRRIERMFAESARFHNLPGCLLCKLTRAALSKTSRFTRGEMLPASSARRALPKLTRGQIEGGTVRTMATIRSRTPTR